MNSDTWWAFKRWKHQHEDDRKALKALSKNQLVKKCIDDEQLLGSLESQIDQKDKEINEKLDKRDGLLNNFAAG